MPIVTFNQVVPLNGSVDVALAPFDRFGGGGGRVAVQATSIAAESGDVNLTLMIGSDTVQSAGPVFGESVAGIGPTNETPAVSGFGGIADPITVRLENTTGADITISGRVIIENR